MRRVAIALLGLSLTAGLTVAAPLAANAVGGSVSVTAASMARDASSGNLQYDVSGTATDFSGPGAVCSQQSCRLALIAQYGDGSTAALGFANVPQYQSSPYDFEMTGSTSSAQVVAVRVQVIGYIYDGSAQSINSDWFSVSDPYPAPSSSLSVTSISRDPASGYLSWDATATLSNFELPDNFCSAQGCVLVLEGQHADGSYDALQQSPAASITSSSYSYHFTGSAIPTKLTGMRVRVMARDGSRSSEPGYVSDPVPVVDPYRPQQSAQVTSGSVWRSIDGLVNFDATGLVSDAQMSDAYCPGWSNTGWSACQIHLEAITQNGDAISLQSQGAAPGSPSPVHVTFHGSTQFYGDLQVVGLRIEVIDPSQTPQREFTSGAFPVSDVTPQEQAGGGNPSENGCGCSKADPVNTATGEFYQASSDLSLAGVGPAVNLGRTYSSLSASTSGPFGSGWNTTFASSLSFPDSSTVVVSQENGSTVTFVQQSDGSYQAPPWVAASLVKHADGTYTFVRRAVATMQFDSDGRLLSIADPHGNTVSYSRDSTGRVTEIDGSGGRSIGLTWTGTHVTSATDSANRTVSYGYDTNDNLTSVTAADGGITTYTYDGSHLMTSFTRPEGGTTTNVYGAANRVASQTDPEQRVTSFDYDGPTTTTTAPDGTKTAETYAGGDVVKQVVDVDGDHPRTTTWEYDQYGNPSSITDPRGKTSTFTYDANGNVLTKTDPLQHTATFTYDGLNDVLSSEDALGKTSTATYDSAGDQLTSVSRGGVHRSWTYNPDGTVLTATDGRGKVTSYTYDSRGLQTSMTDPDSRTSSTGYNAAGFVTSQTNGANEVTNYTRDPLGRILTVTTPGQHTTTNTYDLDGNLATVTDARGNVTTSNYDAADELKWTQDPLLRKTSYSYDADGRLRTTTDANSRDTTRGYDAFGDLTSVTDPNSHTTEYGYDADGDRTSTTLPSGAESTSSYDDAGLLASTTDAKGKTTSYGRDADGQVISTTDPLNRVTQQTWTDDGQQKVTTQPDGSTIQQTYDADGALLTYTNADGLVTSYSYTDTGLPLSRTEPGSMVTSYTYDDAGRLKTTTTPDGHVTTLSYDPDGDVATSHSDVTGSTDATYSYNEDGQRTAMHDATGDSSYSYDSAGELISTTNGADVTVGYDYTPTGNVSKITYPGSKDVSYQYDDAGQMSSVKDWANRTTSFSWTQDGQLQQEATPNGLTQTSTYDQDGQTTDIAVAGSTTLADYGYSYDAAGELTADTTTDPLGNNVQHQYTYDDLSQLASVQGSGSPSAVTASSGGALTETADGTTYSYNSKQQLTSSTPTSGPASTYTYDGNGSRTSATVAAAGSTPASTTTYTYDSAGNLATATLPSGTTVSYTADGDGLRQSRTKESSTSSFLWDTQSALPLLLDDGTDSYIYGPSNAPIAQIDDSTGTIQYLHGDLLGSTRLITDATGSAIGEYRYSAFGSTEAHTGATSAIEYTGNWTDPDTGDVYLRARDYDPATGQLVQVDPAIMVTRQPYSYASDSPALKSDPTGLMSIGGCIGGQVIALTFGFTAEVCAVAAIDSHSVWTAGITYTKSGFTPDTPTAGTPSIGINAVGQTTNAQSVNELAGESYMVGASRGDYTSAVFIDAQAPCQNRHQWLVGREAGLTVGVPSVEVHAARTRTQAWQVAKWPILTPFEPPVKGIFNQ